MEPEQSKGHAVLTNNHSLLDWQMAESAAISALEEKPSVDWFNPFNAAILAIYEQNEFRGIRWQLQSHWFTAKPVA